MCRCLGPAKIGLVAETLISAGEVERDLEEALKVPKALSPEEKKWAEEGEVVQLEMLVHSQMHFALLAWLELRKTCHSQTNACSRAGLAVKEADVLTEVVEDGEPNSEVVGVGQGAWKQQMIREVAENSLVVAEDRKEVQVQVSAEEVGQLQKFSLTI